jgi:glycosyltransferase involved in cell wall biosynthesis
MDVLVCAAQVPFMPGAVELAAEDLVRAFEACGHRAELVRLPTVCDPDAVFDAAFAWRLVPAHADLVVALDFPAYYIRHPRKVVWLHHHRPYDSIADDWARGDAGCREEAPGAARLLADWDDVALGEARRIYTISRLVAERLGRGTGLRGEVLHHPPPLHDRLHEGGFGSEVLCPTRFVATQRPGLLVDAVPHLRSGTRVVLAGRGPDADALAARVAELRVADRVTLASSVPDDELVDRFAECLAVVYTPYDEDDGYVALQAFLAGKPVVTSADSGGVVEWIEDRVNGIVTDGSPEQLAAAIDRLAADPGWAAALGRAGQERARALNWDGVVRTLVED